MFPLRAPCVFLSAFLLVFIPLLCAGRTLQAGDQVRTLTPDSPITRDISAGEVHRYGIDLLGGQFVHLHFDQRDIDLTVDVVAPDGRKLVSKETEGSNFGRLDFPLVVETAGRYILTLGTMKASTASGSYTVGTLELRPATAQDRSRYGAAVAFYDGQRLAKLNTTESRLQAIQSYGESLRLWRAAGNEKGDEAFALIMMGRVQATLAQYQKALDSYNEALAIARSVGSRLIESDALANIGAVYGEIGDLRKAREYDLQSLQISRALGDRESEATILLNLGSIAKSAKDSQQAIEYYQQALATFRELGIVQRQAVTLNNMASLYKSTGDNRKALEVFEQALALRRQAGDRQGEAATLNNIGAVYEALGDYQKALDYYTQSHTLIHTVGYRRGEAVTLIAMAYALDHMGKLLEARDRIQEAIALVESVRSELVGEEDRANFFASIESYYKYYIDLQMRLDQLDPSAGYMAAAFQASEKGRARTLLDQLRDARINLRQDVDSALLDQERQTQEKIGAETAALRRLLKGPHTDAQATESQKKIDDLVSEYQLLEARIRASSPRYAALTRPKIPSVPEVQRELLDSDTLLLEYSLGADRSYVWIVSQSSLSGFALPKRTEIEGAAAKLYELMTARGVRVRFETPDERQARIASTDDAYSKAARQLSAMLLGPVGPALGKKRLLIVSDGALQFLPFAALPSPINTSRPLIADHEIVNIASAAALSETRLTLRRRPPAQKTVAVLADPVFDKSDERVRAPGARDGSRPRTAAAASVGAATPVSSSDVTRSAREAGLAGEGASIPRLPSTRKEAAAIIALVPRRDARESLDFDASRTNAMSRDLSEYRYVHFATHGFLNNETPELSGIVLSLVDKDGNEQNGFLRASDIFHLRLPAELVTLSGCRTGLGKEIRGEGLVGLTQGFMYAGAARVMVSLWDVNDQATAEFMGRFYRNLLGGDRMTAARALREAQLSMAREPEWKSPYYWAAFVLQGEPR